MKILEALCKLRFDETKAVYDGEKLWRVDDLISSINSKGLGEMKIYVQGREMFNDQTGKVLFEIMLGQWDDDGKFWPY